MDHAEKLQPLAEVEDFCSRLQKSVLNSTQPVVDDVLIDPIVSAASPRAGYVRCWVPASEKTPHRAMLAGREYWRRTAEGFYRLERLDLEDMFGRRPRPLLDLQVIVDSSPVGSWRLRFQLRNIGRAVARFPAFTAKLPEGFAVREISPRQLRCDGETLVWSNNDMVIHISPTYSQIAYAELCRPGAETTEMHTLECELFADRMWPKPVSLPVRFEVRR